MKIILIRHGESESNVGINTKKDSPLTERGKKQVEHLADRLKQYRISEIYCSNLIRAKQTAEIISKKIKAPIKGHFSELNEYSSKHLKNKIITLFHLRLKKLKKLLKNISKEKRQEKVILISSHGVANRIIIGYLLKISLSKKLLRLTQDNACINFLSWNQEHKNWSLWSVNDSEHLPKDLRNSQEINFLKNNK